MGYFSNGTEGLSYEEDYCFHCIHDPDECAVLLAHDIYNYKDCNKKDSILHILIPRDGLCNGKCKMFIAGTPDTEKVVTHADLEAWVGWVAQ